MQRVDVAAMVLVIRTAAGRQRVVQNVLAAASPGREEQDRQALLHDRPKLPANADVVGYDFRAPEDQIGFLPCLGRPGRLQSHRLQGERRHARPLHPPLGDVAGRIEGIGVNDVRNGQLRIVQSWVDRCLVHDRQGIRFSRMGQHNAVNRPKGQGSVAYAGLGLGQDR